MSGAAAPAHPVAPPLHGWPLFFAALAVNVALFLEVLDMTIVNVAVPAIAGDLGSSQTEATWAITSYALMAAVSQPFTGWLTRRFGEIRLFMTSTMLFTVTSMMCGMANSVEMLVFCRLLQGFVSGPMVPLSQALIMTLFPPEKKALAQALWAICGLVAPIFGPILGGWITDSWSWRWTFFINIPTGILAVAMMWLTLRGRDGPTQRLPLDIVGGVLLTVGVASLQFVADHGRQEDWFDSPFIVFLAALSAISLVTFWAWNRHERYPIVDFALLRRRNYWPAVTMLVLMYGVMLGTFVVFSLWLQTSLGYTATLAGWASAVFGIVALITALALGGFAQHLPLRTSATLAALLMAGGSIWLAVLPAHASFWQVAIPRGLQGMAVPLGFIALSDIMFTGIPPERLASATTVVNFIRSLGTSMATAISVTIWEHRKDVQHVLLAENLNPVRMAAWGDAAQQAVIGSLAEEQRQPALATLEHIAQAQAYTLAFNDLCWISAVLFLLLIPLVWIPKPPFGHSGGAMH
ncbi:MAG TPA: DHA2 family efflux MFS transporter permease subunit [Nevskiaceae bacterium]|nr:DHA2 family efflux MFS transporter permease subunit [Nevskiaceae bacterium]